jgi:membrane protein implicated in regulation of membrane protease activity
MSIISAGRGKIKAGDTLWLVVGDDLPAGTPVRVIDRDGDLLQSGRGATRLNRAV